MSYLMMPAKSFGEKQAQVNRIVIHATVSGTVLGGARANARWFATNTQGTSAHYVVDPGEVIQCVPDDTIAHHAPPNVGSIGVELCDLVKGPKSRWQGELHQRMLMRAAVLVAELCRKHNVPTVFVDRVGLVRGHKGITTHLEVSRAWRRSNHSDPGPDFPLEQFLELVQKIAHPTPAPPTTKDDDMTPEQSKKLDEVHAMLTALVAPRAPDKSDVDPQHISLGDVLTKVETKTP